jgi:ribosomal protein L40E
MNKFIDKAPTEKTRTRTKQKELMKDVEIITVGKKQFVICPKCGWKHTLEEEKCRFCGQTLRG